MRRIASRFVPSLRAFRSAALLAGLAAFALTLPPGEARA
jgi:hypothetical protein